MTPDALRQTIETIARAFERTNLTSSPLHLGPCGGCGGPAFQQPCALCSYYPMGSEKGHWSPKTASREFFCAQIEKSGPDGKDGTLASWVARSYSRKSEKPESEALFVELASLRDMPAPGDVFDLVTKGGITVSREPRGAAVHSLWNALHTLRHELRGATPPRDLTPDCRAAVEAIHSGDPERIQMAAKDILATCETLLDLPAFSRNGNVVSARNQLVRHAEPIAGPSP